MNFLITISSLKQKYYEKQQKNFHPIKTIGALVFLLAFTLNIQTSLNGEWELVNVGLAQGSGGSGGSGGGGDAPTCAAGGCNASSCSFTEEISVLGNGVTYSNSTTCVDT